MHSAHRRSGARLLAVCFAFCAAVAAMPAAAEWDPDDLEVPAGEGFLLLVNPADEVFGFSGNAGMWIRDTPILGDYFVQIFWNGIEDAVYAGVGLTVRLMPHWNIAPFVGVGGSYNYSLSQPASGSNSEDTVEGELADRGESYWGGHVEAGIRLRTGNRWSMFELLARYTWSSLEGDRDTWIVGIGAGAGRPTQWDLIGSL